MSGNSSTRSNASVKRSRISSNTSSHAPPSCHGHSISNASTVSRTKAVPEATSNGSLVGNGANIDEETYQKMVTELQDMRSLLSSLVRHLGSQPSFDISSPDDVSRMEMRINRLSIRSRSVGLFFCYPIGNIYSNWFEF